MSTYTLPASRLAHLFLGAKFGARLGAAALGLSRGLCLAGAWALAAAQVQAQTAAPVKPAAAAAATPSAPATDKTNSLGSGKSTSALLSREELRTCLSKEASIRTRLESLEGSRATLDIEKNSIATDQQTLRADRAPLDEAKKQADAFGERARAFAAKVESWNQRVTRFNDAKREGPQAETERVQLNQEREEIGKERAALEADKSKISANSAQAVNAYNVKAQAVDARVADWNVRNGAWNQSSVGLETERQDWIGNCADRRYREDDEKAIQAGK